MGVSTAFILARTTQEETSVEAVNAEHSSTPSPTAQRETGELAGAHLPASEFGLTRSRATLHELLAQNRRSVRHCIEENAYELEYMVGAMSIGDVTIIAHRKASGWEVQTLAISGKPATRASRCIQRVLDARLPESKLTHLPVGQSVQIWGR